jgi:hypothetical protein
MLPVATPNNGRIPNKMNYLNNIKLYIIFSCYLLDWSFKDKRYGNYLNFFHFLVKTRLQILDLNWNSDEFNWIYSDFYSQ